MTVYVAKGELYRGPEDPIDGDPLTPPGEDPPPEQPPSGASVIRSTKPFWWPPFATYPPTGYAVPDKWSDEWYWPGPPWPPGWDFTDVPDWWPKEGSGTNGNYAYDPATAVGSNGERWSLTMPPGPPWPPQWWFEDNANLAGLHRLLLAIDPAKIDSQQSPAQSIEIWQNYFESAGDDPIPDGWWVQASPLPWIDENGDTQNVYLDPADFICVAKDQSGNYQMRGYPWWDVMTVYYTSGLGNTVSVDVNTWFYPLFTWNTETSQWDFWNTMGFPWDLFQTYYVTLSQELEAALTSTWTLGLKPSNTGSWDFNDNDPSTFGIRPPTKAQCIQAAKDTGWIDPSTGEPFSS